MDLKTISATLAILGTGLSLSACKKASTEATEVPSDKAGGGEASCGPNKDGHCNGDKAGHEGSCSGAKTDAAAPAEGSCSGEKADPAAAPEPTAVATPTATATAPDTATSKPSEATTTAKPKTKTKSKAKMKGEAACGEGTCG